MEQKNELQRNAAAAVRRKELDANQRIKTMEWINNRMEDGRMNRCLALVQREAAMEKDYQERTDHAAIVDARAKKETALALAIAKERREADAAYVRRHFLRENDPGLKELMKKLQGAYVCRDMKLQMRNNEYKRLQELNEEHQAQKKLRESLYSDIEYEEREEKLKAERTAQYGQELRQQLVNKQIEKQCQYEDTLIEKKMIEDILRTISDEDKRELEHKRALTEKSRHEMVTSKLAKEAWAAKQREIVLREEKEIELQQEQLRNREAAVIAERKRRQKEREAVTEWIAAKVLPAEQAREERDGLIKLLQEQERLEAGMQDERAEQEKLRRVRQQTKDALLKQMQTRRQQDQQERDIGVFYLEQLKAKMADEEAKEKEKQALIREKNKKHCAELLKQAGEARVRRSAAAGEEQRRNAAVINYHDKWDHEVAEERAKIIKEHVPSLLGYLQAGVLRVEDIPLVKEGAAMKPELAHLDIGLLTSIKREKRYAKCNAQCMRLREF